MLIDEDVETTKEAPVGWLCRSLEDSISAAAKFVVDIKGELSRRMKEH